MIDQSYTGTRRSFCRSAGVVLAVLVVAGGCREEPAVEVAVEPKARQAQGVDSAAGPAETVANSTVATEGGTSATLPDSDGQMHWHPPAGWRAVDAGVPMRLATYRTGPAPDAVEVTVTSLGGDGGGLLANVNRWRRQLGLPPAADVAALGDSLEAFEGSGVSGHLVRIDAGERGLAGAVISPAGSESTYFVKATAPAEAIKAARPEIFTFARSFHPIEDR
ncbi:MAG: hypothetical protein ACFCVE_15770 [Phycisphaerae bacterium]